MKPIQAKTFEIPDLKGISAKSVEEHLKLYAGYVKNANLIMEHATEFAQNAEKYGYELAELHRKYSFEWNGIKNHEYYFEQLEGGPAELADDSQLKAKAIEQWGSWDGCIANLKTIAATTRGIGWAIICYDRERDILMTSWVDEQHLGHFNSAQFLFGIDMWEHSYVADYQPSGKKQYVEDYFANVNWSVVEKRFADAQTSSRS